MTGYAFASYADHSQAELAHQTLKGQTVMGCTIKVRWALGDSQKVTLTLHASAV